MVLTHVLVKGDSRLQAIQVEVVVSLLCMLDAIDQTRVFHEDVEGHLKDIGHLELIAEAFLLLVSVDVAESLAA